VEGRLRINVCKYLSWFLIQSRLESFQILDCSILFQCNPHDINNDRICNQYIKRFTDWFKYAAYGWLVCRVRIFFSYFFSRCVFQCIHIPIRNYQKWIGNRFGIMIHLNFPVVRSNTFCTIDIMNGNWRATPFNSDYKQFAKLHLLLFHQTDLMLLTSNAEWFFLIIRHEIIKCIFLW